MHQSKQAELTKQQIIKKCHELIGHGWKKRLSKRSGLTLSSVSRWCQNPKHASFQLEHYAKIMIEEEQQIKALFPNRV